MRITIINQFFAPDISPTAQLATSLAGGLAGGGHEVTVVASRGGYVEVGGVVKGAAGENPRVYRVWTPRLGKKSILKRCLDYLAFFKLAGWRMLRLPRQDVIIALTTPPYIAWTAVMHSWLHRGTKIVLWNMDCYPDVAELAGVIKESGLLSRVMRMLNRALFRRLAHVVVLDNAMGDLLARQYFPRPRAGKKALGVAVIPNWERLALFPRPAELVKQSTAWEELPKLGLEGKFLVIYTGNMGVGHAFETVIAAAKELQKSDPNVAFLFFGGGKRRAWLEEAKAREHLGNVFFHDYVPDREVTLRAMAAADVALITLRSDMLGIMSPSKLHANLAMGLPVVYVGPAGSNVDEAIGRFGCGVSLREGNAAGLVGFIREVQTDAARMRQLKQAAREAFEQAYCDRQTLPLFEKVLGEMTRD